jgi:hypothetical protein
VAAGKNKAGYHAGQVYPSQVLPGNSSGFGHGSAEIISNTEKLETPAGILPIV